MKALPLLLALLAALPAAADERARIAAERRAVDERYAAEQAECRQRFAVTGCLDEARAHRRAAQADLKRQELVLDDAERKRRASERLQAVERRRAEAASRPAAAASAVVRPVPSPAPAASTPTRAPRSPQAPDAQAAARRAEAAQRLRDEAAEDRRQIREREAQRDKDGRHPAPLPLPPELAASRPR